MAKLLSDWCGFRGHVFLLIFILLIVYDFSDVLSFLASDRSGHPSGVPVASRTAPNRHTAGVLATVACQKRLSLLRTGQGHTIESTGHTHHRPGLPTPVYPEPLVDWREAELTQVEQLAAFVARARY